MGKNTKKDEEKKAKKKKLFVVLLIGVGLLLIGLSVLGYFLLKKDTEGGGGGGGNVTPRPTQAPTQAPTQGPTQGPTPEFCTVFGGEPIDEAIWGPGTPSNIINVVQTDSSKRTQFYEAVIDIIPNPGQLEGDGADIYTFNMLDKFQFSVEELTVLLNKVRLIEGRPDIILLQRDLGSVIQVVVGRPALTAPFSLSGQNTNMAGITLLFPSTITTTPFC